MSAAKKVIATRTRRGREGAGQAHPRLPQDSLELYVDGTGQRVFVHPESKCKGEGCVIHNPSEHSMRIFPTHWRHDRRIMERICTHGIGHPDPDDITVDRLHGCDGCCSKYNLNFSIVFESLAHAIYLTYLVR